MRSSLILLCGVLACSKHDAPGAGSAPGSGSAANEPAKPATLAIKVVADGHDVQMTNAVLVQHPDESMELIVSNTLLECKEALESMRYGVPANDITFRAFIAKRLKSDGTWSYVLDRVGLATFKDLNVAVRGLEQGKPEITLKFATDVTTGAEHWKKIDVDGTVTPTACGMEPIPPDHPALRKANHPSTATLTVAGQHVAIASAVRWPNDLYFSSEPIACSHVGIAARAGLAIMPGEWHLEGAWFGAGVNGSGGLQVATGAKGTSSDGPTIALTLSGSGTSEGYTVEAAGTIEALDCPQ